MALSDMDGFQSVITIVLAIAGVLVVSLVGRAVINRYRRSLLKDTPERSGAWSLDDLREMRESGQLTEPEYQVLRQRLIHESMDSMGRVKGQPNPPKDLNDKIR